MKALRKVIRVAFCLALAAAMAVSSFQVSYADVEESLGFETESMDSVEYVTDLDDEM